MSMYSANIFSLNRFNCFFGGLIYFESYVVLWFIMRANEKVTAHYFDTAASLTQLLSSKQMFVLNNPW